MAKIRADIKISGIVQGVGFRPFIHRCVSDLGLSGEVRNTSSGVALTLEGEKGDVEHFLKNLQSEAPPLSLIEEISVEYSCNTRGYEGFAIVKSEAELQRKTLISPDVATCEDCLHELFSENGRRARHPFINCTNCGPRFTIVKDIPYDRKNTTMADFAMCDECLSEYTNIENRRYHAEPTCCEDCGPRLTFCDADGREVKGDTITLAQDMLSDGKIIAIKGLGGVHLACRTDSPELVMKLRERKKRDEKPFAIMCRDIECALGFAKINDDEKKLLSSPQRPIVLLKKHNVNDFLHISENGHIGIMLPYTPVHHLLLSGELGSLVMTSANLSDLPIIYKDEEVFSSLSGIADGFLTNNREIHVRADDSLLWEFDGNAYFARRSRGYCPYPVTVAEELPEMLACGAEQKASFCLSKGKHVFPSQHIGDLKNLETLENFEEQTAHFENILDISPKALVCDLHPDYLSTRYAEERAEREKIPIYKVWHHHAHMASCMADNGIDEDCIGIVWDGTGLSPDGEICGAEFLLGGFGQVLHMGTMLPITLPGGDIATKNVLRTGIALLETSGVDSEQFFGDEAKEVKRIMSAAINCPKSSGMGRLFDGVSAILGIKRIASYEGQAATLLEAAAAENTERVYPYSMEKTKGRYVFDWRALIRAISDDIKKGVFVSEISAAFMNTLVKMAFDIAHKIFLEKGIKKVVLSGGSFQNIYILKRLTEKLRSSGFEVYTHKRVSANDEGVSLGQIMIAAKGGCDYVSCDTAQDS